MPPKAKFTKQEIIIAAVEIIRNKGIEAVTARELGAKLGSTARPIFTVFKSMDEVLDEAVKYIRAIYKGYVEEGLRQPSAFRGVGMQYIRFASEEPKLFRILFMSEQNNIPDIEYVLPLIEESYIKILTSVESDYGLKEDEALKLYRHLWIYTHGIATLIATGMCSFEANELGDMMSEVCKGILLKIKGGDSVDKS